MEGDFIGVGFGALIYYMPSTRRAQPQKFENREKCRQYERTKVVYDLVQVMM